MGGSSGTTNKVMPMANYHYGVARIGGGGTAASSITASGSLTDGGGRSGASLANNLFFAMIHSWTMVTRRYKCRLQLGRWMWPTINQEKHQVCPYSFSYTEFNYFTYFFSFFLQVS